MEYRCSVWDICLIVPSPPSVYSLVGMDMKSEKRRPWCCADTVHLQLKHADTVHLQLKHRCVITTLWSQTQAKHHRSCYESNKEHSSQNQYRESGGKDGDHCVVGTSLCNWHIHCRSPFLSFSPWLQAGVSWTSYTWYLGSPGKWIMHLTFHPHYKLS